MIRLKDFHPSPILLLKLIVPIIGKSFRKEFFALLVWLQKILLRTKILKARFFLKLALFKYLLLIPLLVKKSEFPAQISVLNEVNKIQISRPTKKSTL